MAYDAAAGNMVLFGGLGADSFESFPVKGTFTWNGTTWTKQDPARKPPALYMAAMAYDPATGTVVMFGGEGTGAANNETWTWDGTNWTEQDPVTMPPARYGAAMAYDPATGTVVMFGGGRSTTSVPLHDTWTWDGTNWTEQHPATSPHGRFLASMAYDAATGTMVLFGGGGSYQGTNFQDTWTWDGTNWTEQHPATSPHSRHDASMAYDPATGNVVLFGGIRAGDIRQFHDTWTWDGTNWTDQHPAPRPGARDGASMAYDGATGNVVLFGGDGVRRMLHDTWTWG